MKTRQAAVGRRAVLRRTLSVLGVGSLLACAATGAACRAVPPPALRVAAAADLRFALDDLVDVWRREHPGLAVSVTYGSSGAFFNQLVNGAPFDVYLSADVAYPRQLGERGLTIAGSEFVYAVGRLAVWVPNASPLDVEHLGLRALLAPGVRHVAIANPAHAPYGRAAEAAMRHDGVYDTVRDKLVLGENVSQALQFVQSGAADVGVVALSLARSPSVAGAGRFWEVPPDAHPRLEQGGVTLKWAADPGAARQFTSLLLSPQGQALLARYGFSLPQA